MANREDDDSTAVESSLDELLAKKATDPALEESDDDVLDLDADIPDDAGSLDSVRAVPQQANEFTCRSCFLVKHRSQIADEKRLICHDCV